MKPGSGNLLQVAHCLMVIILSPCPATDRAENTANSRWASTVDAQIDGLSVVLNDAGKVLRMVLRSITSPRLKFQ